MQIPKDPYILMSYINTKLRDEYPTLDDLCKGLNIDPIELKYILSTIQYNYIEELNRFSNTTAH